jgi:formylglycine-generating enzyme required for sulfatase activity
MSGNVWEWCEDDWHDSYAGAPDDGTAWIDNDNRSQSRKCLRGGSWINFPILCRSANRSWFNPDNRCSWFNPDNRYSLCGFRVACVSPGL